MSRGDVALVRLPHASGARGKRRPVVVVQADAYSSTVRSVVVVEITSNLSMAADPACQFIDVSTPEGQATGLAHDSVVSCLALASVYADAIDVVGSLSPALLLQLDGCLKTALGLT